MFHTFSAGPLVPAHDRLLLESSFPGLAAELVLRTEADTPPAEMKSYQIARQTRTAKMTAAQTMTVQPEITANVSILSYLSLISLIFL